MVREDRLCYCPMPELSAQARVEAIWRAVRQIPRGQTRSYAEVGRMAGLPRGARQVVAALKQSDGNLPWHRVLRADGRIAFPEGSEAFEEQVRRLREEGLVVTSGRVPVVRPEAPTDLDAVLWGPARVRKR